MADPGNDQGGQATGTIGDLTVTARYPGAAGNFHVRFTPAAGQNVLASQSGAPAVRGVSDNDVVLVTQAEHRRRFALRRVAISTRTAASARGGSPPTSRRPADASSSSSLDPGVRHGAGRHRERGGRAERTGCGADGLGGPAARPAPRDRRCARLRLRRVRRDERARREARRSSIDHGSAGTGLAVLQTLFDARRPSRRGRRRRGGSARPELERRQPLARRRADRRQRRRPPGGGLLRGRRHASSTTTQDRPEVASRTSRTSRSSRRPARRTTTARTPDEAHAIVNSADRARGAHALPHRRARQPATARRSAEVRAMRAQFDFELRRALLPVGPDPRPDHQPARSTCRRAASSPASTRATTSTAASTRRRPTRSSTWRIGFERCSTRPSRTC